MTWHTSAKSEYLMGVSPVKIEQGCKSSFGSKAVLCTVVLNDLTATVTVLPVFKD